MHEMPCNKKIVCTLLKVRKQAKYNNNFYFCNIHYICKRIKSDFNYEMKLRLRYITSYINRSASKFSTNPYNALYNIHCCLLSRTRDSTKEL